MMTTQPTRYVVDACHIYAEHVDARPSKLEAPGLLAIRTTWLRHDKWSSHGHGDYQAVCMNEVIFLARRVHQSTMQYGMFTFMFSALRAYMLVIVCLHALFCSL
jgi:hypothetical protein